MDENLEKIILLLVLGATDREAEAEAEKLTGSARKGRSLMSEARKRITLAADYSREEEIGSAIRRLKHIVRRTIREDPNIALAAQKELNKLLNLYTRYDTGGEDATSEAMTACRRHLEPLGLGAPATPIDELCRLAVARMIALQAGRDHDPHEQNRLPETARPQPA